MRYKCDYNVRTFMGEYVIVPAGKDLFNEKGLLTTNELGYFIIKALKDDITMEELMELIYQEYETDDSEIRESVELFLEDLKKRDLI